MKIVLFVTCAIAAALGAQAFARSSADDYSLGLAHAALNSRPTPGLSEPLRFTLHPVVTVIGSSGGEIRIGVTLPEGLSWGARGPSSSNGCTTVSPVRAECVRNVVVTEGTNRAASFEGWDVVATRPGTYTIEGTVESATGDPNPADNSASLTVRVEPAAGGVALRPRRPLAGKTVVAAHSVWLRMAEQVTPVATGSVRCKARIGGTATTARGALNGGRATCTIKIPSGAKGKALRGTITTSSGGLQLVKAFAATVR